MAASVGTALERRLARVDWTAAERALDEDGFARLPRLLTARDCRALIRLYADDARFRSTVVMERHGYGQGQYRYFARPLPPLVEALRRQLYRPLAAIANRWREKLGHSARFPATLAGFLAQCREAGQQRPTPLLLRYEAGGFNRLHQDVYGELFFPFQVVCLLSRPEEFSGGEFLLTEQRPRMQSRGHAITLRPGEALIFPNSERPVTALRGHTRVRMRHGVSTLHSGCRVTLGIIFHDAK